MTDQPPVLRLAILGATGPTGCLLTQRALELGHDVTAVVRLPEQMAFAHDRLRVRPGDVLTAPSLVGAFDGADAVLSALGVRGNQPTTLYSTGIVNILQAMRVSSVSRFVGITARPIAPASETTALERGLLFPVLRRFFGRTYEDMARMEMELLASDITWTVLRPPRLVDSPARSTYRSAVGRPLPKARAISRADLAQAMLDSIEDWDFHGQAVAVAN